MKFSFVKLFSVFVLFSILLLGWQMQSLLLLRGDVSALLHETVKLFAGGKYGKDFFEPNPPMILFLYSPAILIMKWFSLNIVLAFRLFVFFLGILSLSLSYYLLKKIFSASSVQIRSTLLLFTLALIYFVLPFGEFGQREHLLILLTMPYFLFMVCRLEKKYIPISVVLCIAIIGFVGFVVKPHYLLLLLLVELYHVCVERRFVRIFRAETIVILLLLLGYVSSIFIFFPEYVYNVVPLVARYYYSGLGVSFRQLIFNSMIVFCSFVYLFYFFFKNKNVQTYFSTVLVVVQTGFLITYIIQDTDWYYHLLPAFSVALFLQVYFFTVLLETKFNKEDYFKFSAIAAILFGFLLHAENVNWSVLVFMPNIFFCYFAILFAILMFVTSVSKNVLFYSLLAGIICGTGYLFTEMARHTPWFSHRFLLTIVLLIMMFMLFVSDKRITKIHSFFALIVGMQLFAFPVYAGISMFYAGIFVQQKSLPLIHFLNEYAENKSIMFFSSNIEGYPLVDYGKNINYASRYPFLIWVPSVVFNPALTIDKEYYINTIAQELNTNKPDYVFVDVKKFKAHLNYFPFEFISYFSENKNFRIAWRPYTYFMTLEVTPIFKFRVYQRSA